jgi:hypothetical protein
MITKLFKEEKFLFYELSFLEQEELYNEFKNSYLKATGTAWDKNKFDLKAMTWTFYGSKQGGVAVRVQNSGLIKLNASFGPIREIYKGFNELLQKDGNKPIWGGMSFELLNMVKRFGFITPPVLLLKFLLPNIKKTFGDEIQSVNSDGSFNLNYDGKIIKKYFIANKAYYKWLLKVGLQQVGIKIPEVILKIINGIIK